MKNQQGFSLVELLIVVAIIAIIAAIAVPSLLTARMATNEAAAIQGCRTVGSAEIAYSAVNNQSYAALDVLVTQNYLDNRYTTGINGYTYAAGDVAGFDGNEDTATGGFGFIANTTTGAGRYSYGIAPDQVVRYQGPSASAPDPFVPPKDGSGADMTAGAAIGKL